MQALSRQLAEDLQARFQGLLAQEAARALRPNQAGLAEPGPADALRGSLPLEGAPENVVRPVAFQRDPAAPRASSRPDVAAAIDTVVRAAEVLKAAEQDADDKTQRALNLAFRTISQLEKAEGQLRAAYGRIEELAQSADAARTSAERLAVTERTLAASQERTRDLEGHVAHLAGALAAAEARADAADHRAQAAETLACEAQADVRYLADKVSEVLGVRS